ncbi:MAG: hypothetical protein AB1568_04810 [Thermodesulfobacteriota bacterium]
MWDFDEQDWIVSPNTDNMGPVEFDFAAWLPPGRSIAACDVAATLDGAPADPAALPVEPGSIAVVGTTVQLRLQYPPGATAAGRYVLIFKLTLDDASTDEARFKGILLRP